MCFCEILILAILGQLGDWLLPLRCPFGGSQKHTHPKKRTPMLFSPSEAFKPSILFHRGSDWPTLGPPDFSEEKCKGPMAPPNEQRMEITMKMHCQDFEKIGYLFFVKFLSWRSWAYLGIGFYFQDTHFGEVNNARKTDVFVHLLRPSRHLYFSIEAQIGPL